MDRYWGDRSSRARGQKMKTMLMAATVAGAMYVGAVTAGEDSTDRFGAGGTGMAYYRTNCGLVRFQGPVGNRDERRPCGRLGLAYDEKGNLIASGSGVGGEAKPAGRSAAGKPEEK